MCRYLFFVICPQSTSLLLRAWAKHSSATKSLSRTRYWKGSYSHLISNVIVLRDCEFLATTLSTITSPSLPCDLSVAQFPVLSISSSEPGSVAYFLSKNTDYSTSFSRCCMSRWEFNGEETFFDTLNKTSLAIHF